MPQVVRQKATPEEVAEARGDGKPAVRAKATPEELAEASGAPAIPEQKQPSTGSAALHGAVQGGTVGFGDEFQGLVSAALKRAPFYQTLLGYPSAEEQGEENIFSPTGFGRDFGDDYRRERDAARAEDAENKAAHPVAFGAGEVAGTLALPLPGAGRAKGAARAVAYGSQGATLGGGSALGHSEADLTKGDPAAMDRAEHEMGIGAAIGAPLSIAGGAIGDKLASKAGAAREVARAMQQKLAEKGFASARGALGGEVSSAARTLELLEKAATDPSLPEDISRSAAEALAGPEGAALKAQVMKSSLGRFPDQLARITNARDAMAEAGQKLAPDAVEAATAARVSPSSAASAVGSRLKTLAQRFGPAVVLGSAGAGAGGWKGALLGTLAGSGIGAGLGKPGTVIANALKDPAVVFNTARAAEPVARAGSKVMSEEAGALAPYLELLREREQ